MREPPSTSDVPAEPDVPAGPPTGPAPGTGPGAPSGPPPGPPGQGGQPAPGSRRRRWLGITAWVLGTVLFVAVVAGFFVHVPYVIISPGYARPLDDSVVTIEGAPTYGSAGNLLYLTVTVSSEDPNVWKYLLAQLDDDKDVEPREAVVGCLSDADNRAYNTNLMSQSQDDATKVALERLGYAVTVTARRLLVTEVCPGVPAHGVLRVGDEVLAIAGAPVTDGDAVTAALTTFAPGDAIPLTVRRDGAEVTLDVPTGEFVVTDTSTGARQCVAAGARNGTGDPCFGIALQAFVDYQFPIDVQFDLASVGGPSAGLAFALAIVDDLTPGDLTGGQRVAITGAISPDGTVEPVGGVEQKAITARTQGVDLMLVPRVEVEAARRGAGDMPVVGVDTLDDALRALEESGGMAVPPPTTTAARS